jgi:uncharacterized membrane protein
MPSLAPYHPQIVHFVVALLFVGVALRLVSLTGRARFSGPAAATLVLLGTLAAFAAVRSGTDAHGPVERIPGVRPAVQAHELWGERARNVFVVVAALEVLGLALVASKSRFARLALALSGAVGVVGLVVLYEAAARGGELVYTYAGGPGLRSGRPEDAGRLLGAGLYVQAMRDREAGRRDAAADLIALGARRFPDDLEWQLLLVDSLVEDRRDPQAALARLASLPRIDDPRLHVRAGLLKATAQQAAGDQRAARATLEALKRQFPTNAQVDRRLRELASR